MPATLDSPEPIVVLEGAFERESRTAEEERGTVLVTVLVVREAAAYAEDVAVAAEQAVRRTDWGTIRRFRSLPHCGHRHYGAIV